jgi:hypothetical protein
MPDIWMDVDADLSEVPVNIFPLIDDTDFKTIEDAVTYNATGMALFWHFVTCAGAYTVTGVTPTTGGNYDWTDQGTAGIYTIKITASGGASINNDTEGVGWFTGKATGVLAWRGPTIGFRRAALNDMFIEGSTASTNFEDSYDGTGYVGGTIVKQADVTKWQAQTALAVVNCSPVCTLGAAQAAYAPAKAGDAMTLANDAITASKFDESTAFPLAFVDSGVTAVARVGADSDTLETLSDQIDTKASVSDILDHALVDHLTAGTVGNYIAQSGADMEVVGNQLILKIGATTIKTYDLTDANGDPTMTDVYERTTYVAP